MSAANQADEQVASGQAIALPDEHQASAVDGANETQSFFSRLRHLRLVVSHLEVSVRSFSFGFSSQDRQFTKSVGDERESHLMLSFFDTFVGNSKIDDRE